MIKLAAHEGDILDDVKLIKEFQLDAIKDVSMLGNDDAEVGPGSFDPRINFVGFATNAEDDLLVVFPKHFRIDELSADSKLLFGILTRSLQKGRLSFGDAYRRVADSSFPFAAFFGVYDYYQKYGLYFDERNVLNANSGDKIIWKETIRLAGKYVDKGNKFTMFPFFFRKKMNVSSFLTTCMAFVINYTIDKFGLLLGIPRPSIETPNIDYLQQRTAIVSELIRIRKSIFKDTTIRLLDSLIAFFQRIKSSGHYWLKHYSFESVWEDAVRLYLTNHFAGIAAGHINLEKNPSLKIRFEKPTFSPNLANGSNFIQPDCYATDGSNQYIFDAKYYRQSHGIFYKELVYYFLLRDIKNKPNDTTTLYKKTYCAVFLPSEERKYGIGFQMDPKFNGLFSDACVFEEYLDTKEVLSEYK